MSRRELESIRVEALRQLQQEQQQRDWQLAYLKDQIAELEAARRASAAAMVRATQPLSGLSKCPQCWIWSAEKAELKPVPEDNDELDRFRCTRGHEFNFRSLNIH